MLPEAKPGLLRQTKTEEMAENERYGRFCQRIFFFLYIIDAIFRIWRYNNNWFFSDPTQFFSAREALYDT